MSSIKDKLIQKYKNLVTKKGNWIYFKGELLKFGEE